MAATEVKHRNPLPRGPFGAIVIMYLTNSLSQTILFPFAAVMVQSFGVTDDPAKLGYYAGYLASSAFIGSLLSSSAWGALSDHVGRKPILLIGLTGNMICAILFGLSTSFQWAMTVRFINGLFSTIVATGRSTVAELCDSTNQTQGFALIGTMFGAGLLLGPALGGFLCQPADKYPFLAPPGSLFDTYPFLLPCVVLCGLTALGLISTICFLPETRGRAHAKEDGVGGGVSREEKESAADEESYTEGESGWHGVGAQIRSSLDGDSLRGSGRRKSESPSGLRLPLLKTELKEEAKEEGGGGEVKAAGGKSWNQFRQVLFAPDLGKEGGKACLCLVPLVGSVLFSWLTLGIGCWGSVVSALLFSCLSFTSTAFNEVFPLWCITPWELGGLEVGTNQIATSQITSGLALIPLQLFVYGPLCDAIGAVKALRCAVSVGVFLLFFPCVRFLGEHTLALEVATSLFMALRSVEDPQYLGTINGVTQTINMFFRALSPTAGGSIFAWSTGQRGRFINANLWFYFVGILYVVMFLLSCLLSPRVEERKFVTEKYEEPKEENE